jgi:hypothetical protein
MHKIDLWHDIHIKHHENLSFCLNIISVYNKESRLRKCGNASFE